MLCDKLPLTVNVIVEKQEKFQLQSINYKTRFLIQPEETRLKMRIKEVSFYMLTIRATKNSIKEPMNSSVAKFRL